KDTKVLIDNKEGSKISVLRSVVGKAIAHLLLGKTKINLSVTYIKFVSNMNINENNEPVEAEG
ncbi:4878_t:CDS:2, partial [Scutellospora calospora]